MTLMRAEALEQIRPRRDRLPIPRTAEDVGFAPVRFWERVCLSRAGRWRAAHQADKDGVCCLCDAIVGCPS